MLAVAAHRVTGHGWDNIRLIAAPVATAPIDGMADAALFCAAGRGRAAHTDWQGRYEAWRQANPDRAALLDRLQAQQLPENWSNVLLSIEPDAKGMATRKTSGAVLSAHWHRYCRNYGLAPSPLDRALRNRGD